MQAGERGAALPAAGSGSVEEEGPAEPPLVFLSFDEKREVSDRKPPRKSSGHTYTVKFFLVDVHGVEYLAATGEDQGDAHYLYENQSDFPFLRANNKAEVRHWLEGIIQRSKERAGIHSHLVTDAVPQDPRRICLPKFVGHTHEKRELADGRHRIEWFLLDEQNDAHLAIVGEEKETRDGHYAYRTQGVFDKALPLQVGNQKEVERWIDVMVFHGGAAPQGAFGKAPADSQGGGGPAASGRAHSGVAGDASAHRGASSRAGQAARPGSKLGQKHDLLKQATSNVKKLKTQQAGRLGADPDQEARDVVAAEMARWAQEEAQRREAAKRQALAYATDPLAGKEAAAAKRCLAVLRQAAALPGFLPPAGSAGSHQQQLNLVDTLASLRELAHMHAPLSLVAMPELKECLGQLQSHKHPGVQQLASALLEQWLRTAVAQAQVLTDERYVRDPRSVLEASLASRAAMDPIVSAVTHRTLHPPPQQQQYQLLPGQYPRPGSGPHEREGSRLGGTASLACGDATPASLSARPSEQSLLGLEASAGLGGAPGSGGAAAFASHQTVERRRLDLGGLDSPAGGLLTAAGVRRQQQQRDPASSSGGEGTGGGSGSGLGGGGEEEGDGGGLLAGDSLGPRRGGSDANLPHISSVDLINAPIDDMESEQAELLP